MISIRFLAERLDILERNPLGLWGFMLIQRIAIPEASEASLKRRVFLAPLTPTPP
jgi:hypothetical protein